MSRAVIDGMVSLLRELVEIESPSYSPGVRLVAERVAEELAGLGAEITFHEGDHLQADLEGEGEPVLVVGHTDTVWPVGTLRRMPFRLDGSRAYGPGAYDMKACVVVAVEAVRRAAGTRALRVFMTADEEHGSRSGRPYLARAAQGVAAALVVEPPSGGGDLKTARRGIGRFTLTVTGRASHAGTARSEGASAIEELAHQVLGLHGLTDDATGVSVNVGVVRGGTTENVVAAEAEARIDVRIARTSDVERVEAALRGLTTRVAGTSLSVDGAWTRPPLEPSPESLRLFERARDHGRAIGLEIRPASSGGGSDANLIGALGVPVLDGFGALGGGAHADNEHVHLESLPVRVELLARMLQDPGI
jgi:glutamate carboxypeptidase